MYHPSMACGGQGWEGKSKNEWEDSNGKTKVGKVWGGQELAWTVKGKGQERDGAGEERKGKERRLRYGKARIGQKRTGKGKASKGWNKQGWECS